MILLAPLRYCLFPTLSEERLRIYSNKSQVAHYQKCLLFYLKLDVRLQFVANNNTVGKAAYFSGIIGVKRVIQKRTLRKLHKDQHWNNAFTRYHLEWIIELRSLYKLVEFFWQDDKVKIVLDDLFCISIGVCRSTTSIVPAEGGREMLCAMDHDFKYASLSPSMALHCNFSSDMSGSFFSSGVDGFGQISVTLHDSIYDGSRVLDHCAQLCDTLTRSNLISTVLSCRQMEESTML